MNALNSNAEDSIAITTSLEAFQWVTLLANLLMCRFLYETSGNRERSK